MGLNLSQIRKEIAEPRKRRTINRAVFHQNRIRFHAQTLVTADMSQPVTDFLAFVSNIIPEDKFKIFKTLFRFPVKTNEITSICFSKLHKIFDGCNPAFNYQFKSSEMREDWESYRLNMLDEPRVWATKGWEYFKTEINSVLIVDLPLLQQGERPAPYFYFLPISQVITYEVDRVSGNMRFIIFRQGENKIAVIDDRSYRLFKADKGNISVLLSEHPHDLGYCPARFFWDEAISLREPDVKKSPLTEELESLDWFLFYHLSKRHLDLYGSYPIYSGYEQSCDFSNEENGDYCDGGYLKDRQGHYKLDPSGLIMRCPKCGNKHIVGVGSYIEVPVPLEGQPDLRNPVQMLTVDRNSLDYNVEEENRLRSDIITAVVGTSEEITAKQALNEQQIAANFENQNAVLNKIKKSFEAAQQFVDETVCKLRYGDDFTAAKIDLGTEFYIYDANELRKRYKTAKESGASESELEALQTRIIETEYRNDPLAKQRMLLLSELEPYKHLTRDEVVNLYDKGIISQEELLIKLNFANLIKRFERENINILDFGTQIPFNKKIETIKSELIKYITNS